MFGHNRILSLVPDLQYRAVPCLDHNLPHRMAPCLGLSPQHRTAPFPGDSPHIRPWEALFPCPAR